MKRTYRRITSKDRLTIAHLRELGWSYQRIGNRMKHDKSVICRVYLTMCGRGYLLKAQISESDQAARPVATPTADDVDTTNGTSHS